MNFLQVIDVSFFEHLGLLASIIIGLTIFKVASCKPFKEDGEQFDWKKLILGLLGNALVALAISLVYSAGSIWGSDLVLIKVSETNLTIQSALDLMLLTAIGTYGVKLIKNFASMLGLDIGSKVTPVEVIDYNLGSEEEIKG